jgi:hypothetical protein
MLKTRTPKFQEGDKIPPGTVFRKDQATQDWFDRYYRRPVVATGGTPLPPLTTDPSKTVAGTVTVPPVSQVSGLGISADTTPIGGSAAAQIKLPASNTFVFNPPSTDQYRPVQNLLGTSGNQQLRGGSGNQTLTRTDGDQNKEYGRKPLNVRPAVDVLNYLVETAHINKIKKQQLARKNMYYQTPQMSVRPIQDLSPEILAAQQNELSQIRSEYAGSDPVLNLLYKNVATANRTKTGSEQIAGRSAALAAERSRWDTQTRENQKLAADTAKENLDRAQDFADYRLSAENAAQEAKKTLDASFLSQIGLNLDTAAQFNLTRAALMDQAKRQKFQDKLAMAALLPEGQRTSAMEDLQNEYEEYAPEVFPTYGDAQRMWRRTRSQERFDQERNNNKTT